MARPFTVRKKNWTKNTENGVIETPRETWGVKTCGRHEKQDVCHVRRVYFGLGQSTRTGPCSASHVTRDWNGSLSALATPPWTWIISLQVGVENLKTNLFYRWFIFVYVLGMIQWAQISPSYYTVKY